MVKGEREFLKLTYGAEGLDYPTLMKEAEKRFTLAGIEFQPEYGGRDAEFHRRIFSSVIGIELFFEHLVQLGSDSTSIEIEITSHHIAYEIAGIDRELTKWELDLATLFFTALFGLEDFYSIEQDDSGLVTFSFWSDSFDRFLV